MEQSRSIIACDHVGKTFFSKQTSLDVVGDLNLRVSENEFVVLFGPGQCGKTTIINLLAGIDLPTAGSIVVNGKKVEKPEPERGVVYQSVALFPWLTTMGNVEYGPMVRGVPKKERREKAQYYINLVGLKGFEKSFPNQLSGGMKQRVGIARAYCNEPAVMLLDEPFGALDAQTRYLMQEEIERIWNTAKRTVVFVTNNLEEAIYLADRIVVLKNCPTSVKSEFQINLNRPRNYVAPEFLRIRREISAVIDETK
jgi:NitT/TauT family transport system ATP-binding protein/sulfonate transport system ATP-binding protein